MNIELFEEKYDQLQKIHEGPMSTVMKGEDRNEKQVIIKAANMDNEIAYNSIISEINILKNLNHPQIPKLLDVIKNDKVIAMVMEYKEGESLSNIISNNKVSVKLIIKIAIELCSLLSYIESFNEPVIHRDIKPENIIVGEKIYLIDFGAARRYAKDAKKDTVCLGTYGYAAPEQFGMNMQSDQRTDIYGLGMTLRKMYSVCNKNDKKIEKIIEKCVDLNPLNRYQRTEELLRDLYCINNPHYRNIRIVSITLVGSLAVLTQKK